MKKLNLAGLKFGKWTVLYLDVNVTKGRRRWMCRCECGVMMLKTSHHIKHVQSCVKCRPPRLFNPPDRPAGFLSLIGRYRSNAIKRGYEWSLTSDQARVIFSSCCVYCGSMPQQVHHAYSKKHGTAKQNIGKYIYMGIDRVDNSIGYVDGNCKPCCRRCNIVKGNGTVEDLLQWIRTAYVYNFAVNTTSRSA